ncbi:MAG: PEP-CTERM sorting domain-containing protein [Planctomycetaceae bacterium]
MRIQYIAFAAGILLAGNGVSSASSILYQENFDVPFAAGQSYITATAANLGSEWSFYSSTTQGLREIFNWGGSRGGVLILHDGVNDSTYTLNEAILTIDLLGKTNVELGFDHYDSNDEEHPMGTSAFTGHLNKDGVAISSNGTNWFPLINFSQADNTWVTYSANISSFIASLNNPLLQLTSQFFIKFQQYDNRRHGDDGRKFDNLVIAGMMPPDQPPGQGVVPEPATATLFGIGLIGMAFYRRRRRQA